MRHPIRPIVTACAAVLLLGAQTSTARPAPAVIGAIAAGAAAGELIHGPRAWAFADADGNWISDPPGVTAAQYNAAASWRDLPYKGGWFTTSAHAIAPSVGPRGSAVTCDADAHIGLLAASANVTYPVRTLGTVPPNPYYWANGAALGGIFARSFPGPASGLPDAVIPAVLPYSIGPLTLDATDGGAVGVTASEDIRVVIDVYLFPHTPGPITEPGQIPLISSATAEYHVMNEVATLSNVGGITSFTASTPLFSAAGWSGGGASRSMAEISGTLNFNIEVPDTWQLFDLLVEYAVLDEVAAAVPEPVGIAGLMLLTGGIACRRTRRS